MSGPLSKAAYEAALFRHKEHVEVALRRLDGAIERDGDGSSDPAALAHLRTMRVLLLSGLFDTQFYLDRNPDVRAAQIDPIEHYVRSGEQEGRIPNPEFLPGYYRRQYMGSAAAGQNALQHYIEKGEPTGARPNRVFDPLGYIAANPGLTELVDRPMFHYLNVGQAAGGRIVGILPTIELPALEYLDTVERMGVEQHELLFTTKRALIDNLGLSDGFASYRKLVARPDHAELKLKRLLSLREFAAISRGAFRETAVAGEPFVVPPPKVVGAGKHHPLEGRARSMFVACLIDARVRCHSSIIEVDDFALLDYPGNELTRLDDQIDYDPTVFHATGDTAWVMTPKDDTTTIEIEEAFTLLGVFANGFGHWMIEYLAKFIGALLSGALPSVPVLIESGMPRSHRQAIELMLPDGSEIIELPRFAMAHVRRLWCAPTQVYIPIFQLQDEHFKWEHFVMHPTRMAVIIREMARRVDHAVARPTQIDRVFLARAPSLHHKLVNRAVIEVAAEARGFRVVDPSQLDFVEQVRLVRHASFIIGPDGSQMFLAFFARPGTKLCIFSNVEGVVEIQAEHGALYTELDVDYTVITGPTVHLDVVFSGESDYEIDEAAFCRFLDVWLEEKKHDGGLIENRAEPSSPLTRLPVAHGHQEIGTR